MKTLTIIAACLTAICGFLSLVDNLSAQSVRYPGEEVKWGQSGRVNYPNGSINWGYGNGYVNFPGGGVEWTNRGNGGVRINVPGFNGRIRW